MPTTFASFHPPPLQPGVLAPVQGRGPIAVTYGSYARYSAPDVGWVALGGVHIMALFTVGSLTGHARARIVAMRLNAILDDPLRDLDFILPTVDANGTYSVICPLVRRNSGGRTAYLGGRACGFRSGTCGDGTESLPQEGGKFIARQAMFKPHGATSSDPPTANQEVIVTSTAADSDRDRYWERALEWANAIRQSLAGKGVRNILGQPLKPLVSTGYAALSTPLVQRGEPIVEALPSDELCCVSDASGNVYHPQENNCASCRAGSIGLGKWLRVTASETGRSVVCRLTDQSPQGINVEISYQTYVALGKPRGGTMTLSNVY